MRNDSSNSRGNNNRGGGFKKNSGKPLDKSSRPFKRNSEDRSEGAEKRGGKRWEDNDRKPRREFDKEKKPFKREFNRSSGDHPRKQWDADSDRKPRREFDRDKKPFKKEFDKGDGDRPRKQWGTDNDRKPRREFDRDKKPFKKEFDKGDGDRQRKQWGADNDRKPRGEFDKEKKPFKRDFDGAGDDRKPRKEFDKDKRSFEGARDKDDRKPFDKQRAPKDSRPFRDRPKTDGVKPQFAGKAKEKEIEKDDASEKPVRKFDSVIKNAFNSPKKKEDPDEEFAKPQVHEDKVFGALEDPVKEYKKIPPRKGAKKKEDIVPKKISKKRRYDDDDEMEDEGGQTEEQMPLNKYIAHSGECSRRDAAELVKQGKVKVNGELVLDPGYKVKPDDNVTLVGKKLKPQKNNIYILLNKPKGYITTNEDPQGRKTVMELLQGAGTDRIFPVGRLDRDTSGLLLITNDGDLTQRLSHPSFNIKKVYHVTLDKPLTKAHFEKIIEGVELEDGKAVVDEMAYLEAKNELGLEIHSGKNRIVRRIFESLGYVVEKLDRMMYAGLTKKNLPRGKWRHLDPREVVLLKHFKS